MCARHAVRAGIVALLALLVGAGGASAATDHVVITGGAVVPAGQTAGDVVVLDGTVRIAGHATGDVVSVSGPVRVTGRVDGDLIAVSDRAFLGPTARVGGDLRYGDDQPVIVRGASVGGKVSNEDWADAANGWGWVSLIGWWLAVSVSTLIVGVLLVRLAPAALYAAERAVRDRLGATVAWGVGIAIGVPVLAVLALITLVGIPFGVALLLAAIPVLVVAYVTSAWIVGRRVLSNRSTSPWAALLAGWGFCAARPDSGRGRPRRARGDGGGTGSTGRGAMAGRQTKPARREARATRCGPSCTSRLTLAGSSITRP